VPRRTEAVWLRASKSSELATQAHPSQPHSRLMMPVHVGGRLADSGTVKNPTTQDTLGRPLYMGGK